MMKRFQSLSYKILLYIFPTILILQVFTLIYDYNSFKGDQIKSLLNEYSINSRLVLSEAEYLTSVINLSFQDWSQLTSLDADENINLSFITDKDGKIYYTNKNGVNFVNKKFPIITNNGDYSFIDFNENEYFYYSVDIKNKDLVPKNKNHIESEKNIVKEKPTENKEAASNDENIASADDLLAELEKKL